MSAIKMTKSSVKRHNIYKEELRELHDFIDDDDNDTIEITLACDTRWISHSGCLKGLKKKFVVVVSSLEHISEFDPKELNEQLIHSRPRLVAQYLIPSRLSQLSQIAEKNIFDAYSRSDCEYDEKELKIWRSKWCTISEKDKPKTACETLVCMSKDTFPNIYSTLTILATMPVSTATAERSFSTLKRLKTWLRNTMCQSRLTGLALMHLHWNVDVDVERVLRDFDPLSDRRILLAFD